MDTDELELKNTIRNGSSAKILPSAGYRMVIRQSKGLRNMSHRVIF